MAKKETTYNEVLDWVIEKPRITEKAAYATEYNIYVFDVAPAANKIQIKKAIERTYGIIPVKVNIIRNKARRVVVRGRLGKTKATKKALVFVKKGETIDLAKK